MADTAVPAQSSVQPDVAPTVAPIDIQQPDAPSSPDVSRSTIIMLVLLTLVISVLGTWTVLNEVSMVRMNQAVTSPHPAQADVKLNIMTQEQYTNQMAKQTPASGLATGHVIFNIIK